MRRRARDEQGVTMVLLALSLVALMALSGLAVDGGAAYANRRQAQNGADAAALAGTTALNTYWSDSSKTAVDIWNAVLAKATADNNLNGSVDCWYIDANGDPADGKTPCSSYVGRPAVLDFTNGPATGVEVRARDTKSTYFIRVVGFDSFAVSANAAANVQALRGGSGPIMLCAVSTGDARSGPGGGQGVGGPNGTPPPVLNPDDTINNAAIGQEYYLKGNEVADTCKMGSSFKGIVNQGRGSHDDGIQYPLPGNWDADTGNQAGPTRTKIVGSCNSEAVGCKILVPLCYWRTGTPSGSLYCVRMGVFQITFADSNSDYGTFVGEGAVVDGGQGGGKPLAGEARLIKLIR